MAYTPSCMHASMHMALLQALSILLLASMLVPAGSAEEAPSGYHVDANGGFTREELIRPAVDRTHLRAAMQISATLTTEVDRGHYVYLMELKIGKEPFRAVADTGSDYVWTKQLKSCDRSSSTFKLAPACSESCPDGLCNYCCEGLCMFKKTYGKKLDTVKGFMGREKLTLSADNEKSIDFGCAISGERMLRESADGIVGLNQGRMSLVKQLKFTKFSYCLSNPLGPGEPGELKKSPLWFGGDVPAPNDRWNSTPLVPIEGTCTWANKYAVGLDAISIGHSMYSINGEEEKHFTHKSRDGKVVMFLDTGASRTILPQDVFKKLTKLLETELKSTKKSINKYDEILTCFEAPSERPDMVLHFTGTEMHLPWENYMLKEFEGKSEFSCLAINGFERKSILGNFQQQNINMLYDLTEGQKQPYDHGKLSFIQEDCGRYYHDVKYI